MQIRKDRIAIKLGESIRSHRNAKGISQERLIELIDANKNYIGCIERGESLPSITKLCQIAKALKIKPSVLLSKAGL